MTKRDFMDKLLKLWESAPELRFGQLIVDVFGNEDIFYMSNDKFLNKVDIWIDDNVCIKQLSEEDRVDEIEKDVAEIKEDIKKILENLI